MKISLKKILVITITTLCLFLLIMLGLEMRKTPQDGQGQQNQEPEVSAQEEAKTIQECIKEIGKVDFHEMIDLTERLSQDMDFRKELKDYVYPVSLLKNHLRCKFLQEQDSEKRKALLVYIMEAWQRIIFSEQDKVWEKLETRFREIFASPKGFFINNLASGSMSEICPQQLPINCRKDNGLFFLEPDEWCANICETLAQYEKDKDKLNKEVIDFKNPEEGVLDIPGSSFAWRLAVAYRFGGKDLALKVCSNVTGAEERNRCLSTETILETNELSCEASLMGLARLICDYQYKNY